jgi:hypothetical protein
MSRSKRECVRIRVSFDMTVDCITIDQIDGTLDLILSEAALILMIAEDCSARIGAVHTAARRPVQHKISTSPSRFYRKY